MNADTINEIAGFILTLTTIPATLNVLIYGFGSPWWTSWLGRVMFAKWLSVALVFWFVVFRRNLGDFFGYEWWALAIYSFTFVTFVATTVELIIERRPPDSNLVGKELRMANIEPVPVTPTVPDIWYKAQRVLRTAVATLLSALAVWGGFAVVAPDILAELAKILPESWIAWLTVTIGGITAVASVLTRIMANPWVNNLLSKIGLGSVPRSALVTAPVVDAETGEQVGVATAVKQDPKVQEAALG